VDLFWQLDSFIFPQLAAYVHQAFFILFVQAKPICTTNKPATSLFDQALTSNFNCPLTAAYCMKACLLWSK
jgi:hypothetical protein